MSVKGATAVSAAPKVNTFTAKARRRHGGTCPGSKSSPASGSGSGGGARPKPRVGVTTPAYDPSSNSRAAACLAMSGSAIFSCHG